MHKFPTLCLDRKDGRSVFLLQKSCVFSYDEKGIEPSKFQYEIQEASQHGCDVQTQKALDGEAYLKSALSKLLPFIEKNVRQAFEWTPSVAKFWRQD